MLDLTEARAEDCGRVFGAALYPSRVFEEEGPGHASSFFGAGSLFPGPSSSSSSSFEPPLLPAASTDDHAGSASFFPLGPPGLPKEDATLFNALRTRGIGDAAGAAAAEVEGGNEEEEAWGLRGLPAWRRPQLVDASLRLLLPLAEGEEGEDEDAEGAMDPAYAVLRSWAWAQRAATGRRRRAAATAAAEAAAGGTGAAGALRRLRERIAPVGETPRAVPPFDALPPSCWRRVGWESAWRAGSGGAYGSEQQDPTGVIPFVAPLVTQDGPAALEAAASRLLNQGAEGPWVGGASRNGEPPLVLEEAAMVDHAFHALNVRTPRPPCLVPLCLRPTLTDSPNATHNATGPGLRLLRPRPRGDAAATRL